MGRLEDMRRAAKGPQPDPERPPKPGRHIPPQGAGKPPTPSSPATSLPARVKFRCGHEKPVAEFLCGDCATCKGEAKRRKAEARRARKAAEKMVSPPVDPGRLPAGAVKRLEWDGTAWRGTLTIPGCPETFTAEATGEKGCYIGLHDAYVAWRVDTVHTCEGGPGR